MSHVMELPPQGGLVPFQDKRVAIICAGSPVAGAGGAERFYAGLRRGFEALGCRVEFVSVHAQESSVDEIIGNYQAAALQDLSDFDIVVSSKAPTYGVRHPNHVLYLNHGVRIFDDMFEVRFPKANAKVYDDRAKVIEADLTAVLGAKGRFAQGWEINRRLMRWRGLRARVMHPPLPKDIYRPGSGPGEFFFIAGRLHPWKRIDLLIEAFRRTRGDLRLLIAGNGEQQDELKKLSASDERIELLGRIDDGSLADLYSRAVAVPFIPIREDYGYVTLEAFASACPVLTCFDSGEPAQLVRHMNTGLIAKPDPSSIAEALEWFWANKIEARCMGERGRALIAGMSWRETAYALATAALDGGGSHYLHGLRVTVLDMQPIDPPVGGGRLRLLGLYHQLGSNVDCHYVGTYDWPGEKRRAHKLGPSLFETDIPLSEAHFAAARELSRRVNGKNVIDLAFSRQAKLSPDYVEEARKAAEDAEVVVFSHPWVFPLVSDKLRANQVVVYDSHNVEGFLRAQFLNEDHPVERDILTEVISDELSCGQRADWILTCSHEDLLRFQRLYGFSPEKMRVVPNGTMLASRPVPSASEKVEARRQLQLADRPVAIFMGSGYGPNIEAARFINKRLAPACRDVTFVIVGGVGMSIKSPARNIVITGIVDDDLRDKWLFAADFAVNPMMSGSGTNIKMFDFMAMGLPVISTEIGARGIETAGKPIIRIVDATAQDMSLAIRELYDPELRTRLGKAGRRCVEENYSWEHISNQLGQFLAMRESIAGQTLPKFSVVVPSHERPDKLTDLLKALSRQIDRDFEVVVVDQSFERWTGAEKPWGFPLFYYQSHVKGAVRARNTGAMLAQGSIIVFVDDDCLPEPDWLLNARKYFDDPDVVGVEGLVRSDHLGDPAWRSVSNVGFEGKGFMTANLLIRSAAFQYLGGFDLQFDQPHFREDTDLGWRMQGLGKVPYGRDVAVFHPAHPRSLERESAAERNRFFVKDARLWRKHPDRYRELFMAERHYLNTLGFTEYLIEGFADIGMAPDDLPEWLRKELKL